MSTNKHGDIYVADTANHRIQQFTKSLYPVNALGSYGSAHGELNEPTGCAISPDSRTIIVADCRNRRLQEFKLNKTCLWSFIRAVKTIDDPYSVTCDRQNYTIVGTVKRTVEIYSDGWELVSRFLIGDPDTWFKRTGEESPIYVQSSLSDWLIDDVPEVQELGPGVPLVVVSDVSDREILYYTYGGYLLHGFEPNSYPEGHQCAAREGEEADDAEPHIEAAITLRCSNGSIYIHPSSKSRGEILVCDALNHTLTSFSATGRYLDQLLNPRDDLGPVQAAMQTSPGNIVCLEQAQNGRHCLKYFELDPPGSGYNLLNESDSGDNQLDLPDSGDNQADVPDSGGNLLDTPDSGDNQMGQPDSGDNQVDLPDSGDNQADVPDSGGDLLDPPDSGDNQMGQPDSGDNQVDSSD